MKYIMPFYNYLNEKIIKEMHLIDVFGEYPSEDELIWNFISANEFKNCKFEVIRVRLKSIISDDFIDNYNTNALPWQQKLVNELVTDINSVVGKVVIIDSIDNVIIDGNHKLMAMYLTDTEWVNIIDVCQ
jgi:hypothetical protein